MAIIFLCAEHPYIGKQLSISERTDALPKQIFQPDEQRSLRASG